MVVTATVLSEVEGLYVDKSAELAKVAAAMEADNVTPELRATATQIVPGAGNPDAQVLFIGEAPGANEDRLGIPFVGAAGKFFDTMLAGIGLQRDDIFITNILKYRPPGNRDPLPQEITASIPYLKRQIAIIEPQLVAFLGRHSMSVFLPELKISQAHGKPVRKDGQVYLPLYHPAAGLYNPGMRDALIQDFQLIPAIIKKITTN
jgi:uracil-DNA glycosylase family 4